VDALDGPRLTLVDGEQLDASDASPPTREEMLEAVPLNVEIADGVDLDAEDPAVTATGRRACIAVRRAGGRCTAPALTHSYLCTAHAGLLDASSGGRAKAERHQAAQLDAEEKARLARLGTRGVIADTLARNPEKVRRAVLVLLEDAAAGDKVAAKGLIPYLNQGLGMPTERVEVLEPASAGDLDSMTTEQLHAYVASRRAARLEAETA
jgi:hypothetical protein